MLGEFVGRVAIELIRCVLAGVDALHLPDRESDGRQAATGGQGSRWLVLSVPPTALQEADRHRWSAWIAERLAYARERGEDHAEGYRERCRMVLEDRRVPGRWPDPRATTPAVADWHAGFAAAEADIRHMAHALQDKGQED